MTFADSYSTAVRSSNLKSEPATTRAPTDVLGAAGLAAKKNPLAIALLRLFVGDNHAAEEIAGILADMAWHRARFVEVRLKRSQSEDMARKVLAWHRDGTCRVCSGHGFKKRENSPVLSEHRCPSCRGSGKRPFETQFAGDQVELACWLRSQVDREQSAAGAAAMAKLAPSLEPGGASGRCCGLSRL